MSKERAYHHAIYAGLDVVLTLAAIIVSFLCAYGFNGFKDHLIPIWIYAGGIALITVFIFFVSKIYKIITKDFGLIEAIRIQLTTFAIHFAGLFIVCFVPSFELGWRYFWSWALATVAISFLLPSTRFLMRVLNLGAVFSKKEKWCENLSYRCGCDRERPLRQIFIK